MRMKVASGSVFERDPRPPADLGDPRLVALEARQEVPLHQPLGPLERPGLRRPLQPRVYRPGDPGDVPAGHLGALLGQQGRERLLGLAEPVDLLVLRPDLGLQLGAVALDGLPPDEGVAVGVGLDLGAVEEVGGQVEHALLREQGHQLGEYRLEGGPYALGAEAVHGHVVEGRHAGEPHEADVLPGGPRYLPAGVDAAGVGVEHDLEHHRRVVRRGAAPGVEPHEPPPVEGLHDGVDRAGHGVLGHKLRYVGRQEHELALLVGLEGGLRHRGNLSLRGLRCGSHFTISPGRMLFSIQREAPARIIERVPPKMIGGAFVTAPFSL